MVDPLPHGFILLGAAKEVSYQRVGTYRASRFEDCFAVAKSGGSVKKVVGVELAEEIDGNDLAQLVSVVVGGIAGQVSEGCVHTVVWCFGVSRVSLVAFGEQGVRFYCGWIAVVQLKRKSSIEELALNSNAAVEGIRVDHSIEEPFGEGYTGFVIVGKPLEHTVRGEELFQHLRGCFDEVPFDSGGTGTHILLAATQNHVHHVAEFVKEGDHVIVLHQAGITRGVANREVTVEACFRQDKAPLAKYDRAGIEPLVLPGAGMHVEVEPAEFSAPGFSSVGDVENHDGRIPG